MYSFSIHRFIVLAALLIAGIAFSTSALASAKAPCFAGLGKRAENDAGSLLPAKVSVTGNPNGITLLILANPKTSPLQNLAAHLARDHLIVLPCYAGSGGPGTGSQTKTARHLFEMTRNSGFSKFVLVFDAEFSVLAAEISRMAGPKLTAVIGSRFQKLPQSQYRLESLVRSYWPDTDPKLFETMQTIITAEDGRIQATVGFHQPGRPAADGFWSAQFLLNTDTGNETKSGEEGANNPADFFGPDWAEVFASSDLPFLNHQLPEEAWKNGSEKFLSTKAAAFLQRLAKSQSRPGKIKTASN